MGLTKIFARKRVVTERLAVNHYVKGETLCPGAETYSYVSTVADPIFLNRVFPQWNFSSFGSNQPQLALQYLALPSDPPAGWAYGGMQQYGLISPAQYPDVQGDFYE